MRFPQLKGKAPAYLVGRMDSLKLHEVYLFCILIFTGDELLVVYVY